MAKLGKPVFKAQFENPKEEAWSWIHSDLGWDPEHVELNKHTMEKYMKTLLPGKVIFFINKTSVMIDTETGTILDDDSDLTTKKRLMLETRNIKSVDYFNDEVFQSKYIYIYSIHKSTDDSMIIRLAEHDREKKKNVSFTVDQNVYETFCKLADTMAINKSKFVENKIKEFISKNS